MAPAEAVGEEGGEGGHALPQERPRPGRHLQWVGGTTGWGQVWGEPTSGTQPPPLSTTPSLPSDTRTLPLHPYVGSVVLGVWKSPLIHRMRDRSRRKDLPLQAPYSALGVQGLCWGAAAWASGQGKGH